jgi:hypothetical protein
VKVLAVDEGPDFDAAFQPLARERVDALVVTTERSFDTASTPTAKSTLVL